MPIVDGLIKQYGKRIDFQRVNILSSSSQPLMDKFAFSAAPELYLLDRQGKVAANWDDVVSAAELSKAFDQILR